MKPGWRVLSALAGALALGLLAAGLWYGHRAIVTGDVRHVVLSGELDRLSHVELEALSQALRAAGPAAGNLQAVREAARRVPWVRDATVRRRFPDTIEIDFRAHRALARWDDERLVSVDGEVFAAEDGAALPRFRGPEGSAPAMTRQYAVVATAIEPLASPVAELRLSARGAWSAVLDSGLTLQLGRGDVRARLERFVAAWPQLAEAGQEPQYADLRYPNGFAVRRAAELTVRKPERK